MLWHCIVPLVFLSPPTPIDCPYLLVPNDTSGEQLYIHPQLVETELNATSVGVLTVNCNSSGWPPPLISWSLRSHGNITSIYDFPNYNVTENGQVSLWSCTCLVLTCTVVLRLIVSAFVRVGSCYYVSKPGRVSHACNVLLPCE